MFLHGVDRVLNGADRLKPLFRDLDLVGVFDVDHDFERRQRVEPEIDAIVGRVLYFRRRHARDAIDALTNRVADALDVDHVSLCPSDVTRVVQRATCLGRPPTGTAPAESETPTART